MFWSKLMIFIMAAATLGLPHASSAAEPEKLNVLGTEMILKIDSHKTGGVMSVVESVVQPGSGPPKHVHTREDELFYVLQGTFKIWRGDDILEVGEGAVAFLPRDVPHTYQNIGESPGRLLAIITPGGFDGFFREVSSKNLSAPRDMEELTKIAGQFGLQFLGPPPAKPAN